MRKLTRLGSAGMTMIELIVAVTILGVIATVAINVVRQQALAFSLGAGRADVLQNYRFAVTTLETNLRTAGIGVVARQPAIVYADSATFAINADYTTRDTANVFAVYMNPTASDGEVLSLPRASRRALPQTTFSYPDSTYRDGGVVSPAETIVFYFSPDTSTSRADDYVLYRKVNVLAPEVVARSLYRIPGVPFFSYMEVGVDTMATRSSWIPASALPLRHALPLHGAAADTGAAGRVDRIRAVRVSFSSGDGSIATREQRRDVRRLIWMPNLGRTVVRTCGSSPVFASSVSAAQTGGVPEVVVSWSRSLDDGGGENDVVRYAIFRRQAPATDWGEPYFSIPAGRSSYSYTDEVVADSATYTYAVAAQDCTPSMSGLMVSGPVTVTVAPSTP
jgi:prepilin-type N-terminal cleavage/methylation domain-containing protein